MNKMVLMKRRAFHAIKMLFLALFLTSCSTAQDYLKKESSLTYEIINLHNFGDNVLFYKTQSFMPYMEKQCFDFECINKDNVKKSTFLKTERHINFDTIFTQKEQKIIEKRLRASKTVDIDASRLNNPKSLSIERSKSGHLVKGFYNIMLPVVQKSKKGIYYAFFYKNWSVNGSGEGNLYIYVKIDENWKYLCKVPIFVE